MKQSLLVFVIGLFITGNVWADNSRFYGAYEKKGSQY